jgi:RHS repeat-associated protein
MKPHKAARRRKRPNRTPPPTTPGLSRGEKRFLKYGLLLCATFFLYNGYAWWYNDNIQHHRRPVLFGIPYPHVWLMKQLGFLHVPIREAVAQSEVPSSERIVYLHTDHLGGVIATSDQTGNPAHAAPSEPFGKPQNGNPGTTNLGFPGQYYDKEVGLYYNNHRTYNPSTGRYMEPDPVQDVRDSIYGYANNDPIRFVDPDGLSYLVFDRLSGGIALFDRKGNLLGLYSAGNRTTRSSRGPWPEGSFAFNRFKAHRGGPNSSFGSVGNFMFWVPGRQGMGAHSGRADKGGPFHPTLGCIRSTDEARQAIYDVHFGHEDPLLMMSVAPDPLTHISVDEGTLLKINLPPDMESVCQSNRDLLDNPCQ